MDILNTNPFVDLLTVGGKTYRSISWVKYESTTKYIISSRNCNICQLEGESCQSQSRYLPQQVDKKQYLLLHVPTVLTDKRTIFAFHVFSTAFHGIFTTSLWDTVLQTTLLLLFSILPFLHQSSTAIVHLQSKHRMWYKMTGMWNLASSGSKCANGTIKCR